MNRRSLLATAAVVFLAGVALGALAGDAGRDNGGGPVEIPAVAADPIPVVPGVVTTADSGVPSVAPESPFVPTEVAAEFAPVVPPTPTSGGSSASTTPASTTVAPDGTSTAADTGGAAPEPGGLGDVSLEGRGYPWDIGDITGLSMTDLLFGRAGSLYRFLDFCADHPDDPSCPPGIGGTVLAPFGGDAGAIGDFHLRSGLYTSRLAWWTCVPPSDLRNTEYFLMLSATHPARMEITWYPTDDPTDVHSTVVDITDPAGRVMTDFLEGVATTGAPPPTGVHHCFVLDAERRSRTYHIDVQATSFTGETDSGTFGFTSSEERQKPPITIATLSDYEATVVVPVISEPRQESVVRVVTRDEARPDGSIPNCSEIEDDVLAHRRSDVVPWSAGVPFSGYLDREDIGRDMVEAPDWRYDPAYDAYDFWKLNLQEGSTYEVCIWWLRSAGLRSFDPASAAVVDRETRWVTTPDRLRVDVRVAGVAAPTGTDVPAHTFSVSGPGCPYVSLPTADLPRNTGVSYMGGVDLCNYNGYAQPALTHLTVNFHDFTSKDFLIETPNTGEPRVERVRLDLSEERVSGLCGGSFGTCDPPTTTVPGPQLLLDVIFSAGNVTGRTDWQVGEPFTFRAPDRTATALPEEIQIDTFSSRVDAVNRNALSVTATFDRPVTLHASIDGDPAAQCFMGVPPEYTRESATTSFTFVLDGLCTGTGYDVRLDATDPSGSTRAFRYTPDPGDGFWGGRGTTSGYHVSYQVNYLTGLVEDFATRTFNVVVAETSTSLVGDDECLGTRTTPFQESMWGEEVTVEIVVAIDGATQTGGVCRRTPYAGGYQASVTTTFTIDQFRSGRILIPVALEDIHGGTGLGSGALTVVIQGVVLP